jgi:hypothetical protein
MNVAKKAKIKKPKPYRTTHRFGILNPWGDFWTPETFTTEAKAEAYIYAYWKKHGDAKVHQYKIVPARVTVSLFEPR